MIEKFQNFIPKISDSTFVHKLASIIGKVKLGENVSVFPCAVLRGDIEDIIIGDNTNIQDNACLHTNYDAPTIVGKNVTIGHGAVVHGTKIGDGSLIGMNATTLECEIGENCIIGANALVTAGQKIPANSLVMGVPAKVVRQLKPEELEHLKMSAVEYVKLCKEFKNG